MKMIKKTACLFLLTIPVFLSAQDTIRLKNGDGFICKIKKIDSVNVYLEFEKNNQLISTFVNKENVDAIHYYNAERIINPRQNKSEIRIMGGFSEAAGTFKSNDNKNAISGFAKKGINLNASLYQKLSSDINFVAKFYYHKNENDLSITATELSNLSKSEVIADNPDYTAYGMLGGFNFNFPLDNIITIGGNLLFGYGNLEQPENLFKIVKYNEFISSSEISQGAFVFDIGAEVSFNIYENCSLIMNLDYLEGDFKFKKVKVTSSGGIIDNVERGTQRYQVFNYSIGLGFKF